MINKLKTQVKQIFISFHKEEKVRLRETTCLRKQSQNGKEESELSFSASIHCSFYCFKVPIFKEPNILGNIKSLTSIRLP